MQGAWRVKRHRAFGDLVSEGTYLDTFRDRALNVRGDGGISA